MKITNIDTFENDVVKNAKPVLLDCWAEWCGPCKMLIGILESLEPEISDVVDFYKLNIDDNSELASKFGVRSIPTLILFKDGKAISSIVGVQQKEKIKSWILEKIA